jgi:hypothetical protein
MYVRLKQNCVDRILLVYRELKKRQIMRFIMLIAGMEEPQLKITHICEMIGFLKPYKP